MKETSIDKWQSFLKGFESYNMLEKGLSNNSVEAYNNDVKKLKTWSNQTGRDLSPLDITYDDLSEFINWLGKFSIGTTSQARIISGIKAFYKYLMIEDLISRDPSALLESPKIARYMPTVLSIEEIDQILACIDLSHPLGHRNRAMLETLYACGLRVSELISLQISNYFREAGLIKVIGKNDKERIVPIGHSAIKFIDIYLVEIRKKMVVAAPYSDLLFLNRRGRKISRVMVFNLIKQFVKEAGINKNISPHTFRHSFATHLVEGGADLKAVQDMLGHESITTTEIYTHLDTQYLRNTIMKYHPRNIQEN